MSMLHSMVDKDGFRLRGTAMSRIDGFSDVVFGFALTLLVVSLEVPKTYAEMHDMVRGFVPFAVCFTILLMIWYEHYKFFRRLGLHDHTTVVLNSVLLFVVLFYVYPLKFLFTMLVAGIMGGGEVAGFTEIHQPMELMIIYGGGFAAIYFLFAGLYWNGWRQREQLDLNLVERTLMKNYIWDAVGMGLLGLLSCVVAAALPLRMAGLAGFTYMLIGVFKTMHGIYGSRKAKEAMKEMGEINPVSAGAAEGAAR